MALLSSILGSDSGSLGNVVTDLDLMPHYGFGLVGVKTASGAMSSKISTPGFSTTYINNKGSTTLITSANTWFTICDISGEGLFANAISPYLTGILKELEITIDGVTKVFSDTANSFLVIGSSFHGVQSSGEAQMGGLNETGWDNTSPAGWIAHPNQLLSFGAPLFKYQTGLKVRARCATIPTNTGARAYADATYLPIT